jgi:hypothetical protein
MLTEIPPPVIPAPLASVARGRDKAGTQSTSPLAECVASVSLSECSRSRAWVPALSRARPDGRSRRRDDGSKWHTLCHQQ